MGDDRAQKFDEHKPRWDLLSYDALEQVVLVMGHGAKKYGDRNWEKGLSRGRLFAAALRHLTAWFRGEAKDEESGLPHLAHASCCVLFALALDIRPEKFE